MILLVKRRERRLDVGEVGYPPRLDADLAANMHFQPERVAMNSCTLVAIRDIR
jgi:hypothetical protein